MVVPLHSGDVGVARVTLSLDPYDVALLDRMAALQGSSRSAELRELLASMRPMIEAAVQAFEAAVRARDELDRAASTALPEAIASLVPRAERMQLEYLGALAQLEGAAAAAEDPRPSNQGGQVPPTPRHLAGE